MTSTSADGRTANLLGTHALTVVGLMLSTTEDATGLGGATPAALVSLHNYADGESIDVLRQALGLSPSGTVRVVDRMAAEGLVRRAKGDRDGREVLVRLTSKGRRAAQRILAARRAVLDDELVILEPDERRLLEGALEKLLAARTTDRRSARQICRLCDADACGHPERCPVTQAVR
jgi:DNA-binding MarR family transcriptional regulator